MNNDSKSTSTKMAKIVILSIIIIVVLIIGLIIVKIGQFLGIGKARNVPKLLKEKYGIEFKIAYNPGPETKMASDLPTLDKTGRIKPIVMPKDNNEIKFQATYDYEKNKLLGDDYMMSLICYNTAKKIEKDYSIGNEMYVYIHERPKFDFNCTGNEDTTLFDVDDDKGQIYIYIFYYSNGKEFAKKTEEKEYLKNIVEDLSLNYETKGSIFLIETKDNGVEEFKDYFKNDNEKLLEIFTTKKGKELREKYQKSFNGLAFEGTIIN